MTTLLKMELLLCRFLELEYRLPPRDFHPPNPSHYLIPRLYFLLYANHGFYIPHTNLASSSHTTQPVSTGFIEWTSVHHHSVCLLARTLRIFILKTPKVNRYTSDLVSGLANNCSITTLYALYAHGTLERPLFVLHSQPAG